MCSAFPARTERMVTEPTAAVVLAAGGGSRFAGSEHKLRTSIDGRPLYRIALDAVLDAGFETVFVVTGAVALDLPSSVVEVPNPSWAEGQAGSVQAGVRAAAGEGATAVVVGLADQPFVPSEAWRLVAACTEKPICVATYQGHRGNPVRLHSSVWSLLPVTGDEGARTLIRLRADLVCEVACPGHPADIDTQEDLHRWSS
ncbi:MAG TPA: nucleotidyltransferase family protein [Acidimicrobiales bacterium]